jgi:hypothetical protein
MFDSGCRWYSIGGLVDGGASESEEVPMIRASRCFEGGGTRLACWALLLWLSEGFEG